MPWAGQAHAHDDESTEPADTQRADGRLVLRLRSVQETIGGGRNGDGRARRSEGGARVGPNNNVNVNVNVEFKVTLHEQVRWGIFLTETTKIPRLFVDSFQAFVGDFVRRPSTAATPLTPPGPGYFCP